MGKQLEPIPKQRPKAIAAGVAAILTALIVLTNSSPVEHLGKCKLSMHNRLVFAFAGVPACAVCIVLVKIINRPKSDT